MTQHTSMEPVNHKPSLAAFFSLTFCLSWLIWIPLALDHFGLLPVRLPVGLPELVRLLGTLGPAAAALIVTRRSAGKAGLRSLLGRLFAWRMPLSSVAAAMLVYPGLLLLAAGIYYLLPGSSPLPLQPVSWGNLVVLGVILVISVLGEEIGWRGLALPALLQRMSPLAASLLLAAIWTVWHLPFWAALGNLEQFGPGYWLMNWIWISAGSIFITWLMLRSRHNLLLAVLFHWSFNLLSVGVLPLTSSIPAYWILIGLSWALSLTILLRTGRSFQQSPAPTAALSF